MARRFGFDINYQNKKLVDNKSMDEKQTIYDYERGETQTVRRRAIEKNCQEGGGWGAGAGLFHPTTSIKEKDGLLAITDKSTSSSSHGMLVDRKKVNPMVQSKEYSSDEEVEDLQRDPKRPGLKYKRTRKHKSSGTVGTEYSTFSGSFGFNI